jgi:hypothetical protein
MDLEQLTGQLDAPATRRTIVKTGVKLAYAAPLVAATFKMAPGVSAQSLSPACLADTCEDGEILSFCGANGDCLCLLGTAGTECVQDDFCENLTPCSDGPCAEGTGCVTGCCDVAVCAAPCDGAASSEFTGSGPRLSGR